jgi:hypothetical protein
VRNFAKIIILILEKDLKIELREKLNLTYVFILSITLSLIGYTFIGPNKLIELFFFISLIASLVANQRISRQEISLGGELILISVPFDLSIICFAKILFFIIISLLINFTVFITLSLVSNVSIFDYGVNFLTLCILFIVGVSSILSTFSLMLERIKGEGQFMFILIYPLILPFLILAYNSIILVHISDSAVFFQSFSLQALVAFDILLLTVCPILFSYSIRR